MSPNLTEFSASYDRTTKTISAVVCVFLLIISLVAQQVIFGSLACLIVALAYAYSPRGYSV
jgi:hypothetical protein